MNVDIKSLFELAVELPADKRRAFLSQHCQDSVMRREVQSLLDYATGADSLFDVAVGEVASSLWKESALSPGDQIGAYRIVSLIGHGGMGAVYLAERGDGEVEQRVAIKLVRSDAALPSFRDRFLRERQILASLNHPGIARLLDAGHSGGHPYLVMEYVDGVRIDQYASDLEARDIVSLTIKVAEAVAYAHQNLIIHRDLKPSNILVNAAGEPKLLDFGIAKILDATELTRTLDRVMTPEYASPEQVFGTVQATTTDVYSLGAVLYRLLTGLSPRTPADREHRLPRDLACIVSKAMRQEPDERYASVDHLIAELHAFLEHRPVQARRGNAWYLTRKFVRRRWLPVAATALALSGLAGGLLVADHERAIAEHRFQQVRQLSKQFFQLDAEIRSLPGSTKARNHIVTASLQYLERLGSEDRLGRRRRPAAQDLELALEIGSAYLQVARVQGVPTGSNLGQFAKARESLSTADSFVESVLSVPSFPLRRKALLASAEIAHDAMILAQSENDAADALSLGRKVAGQLDALLVLPSVTKEEAAAAGRLYVNLALAHSNMHYLEDAARYARRSVEIARRAGHDQRQLSRALGVLANTARFAGDLEVALQAIRESRIIAEKIVDPDDADSVFRLCAAVWREGLILGELNNISFDRPREAAVLLQRAFDLSEGLARKDPHDYSSRSYLSMAGRELGDILREADPVRSLAAYDHAFRRLAEIKDNTKARSEEVWLLAGSSYALRRLNRPAEAGRRIEAALATLRMLKRYPSVTIELGEDTDAVIRALADHYAETGQTAAAIKTYEELHEKVQASNPRPGTDLRHANGLSRLYRDLGKLRLLAGQAHEAAALNQRRLELWRRWDEKLPKNTFVLRQLAAIDVRDLAKMPSGHARKK